MGCLSLKKPEEKQALREEKRKKRGFASGIRQRWLRSILGLMAIIVILLGVAFSVANGAYTYSTMRSGLEAEANTTAAFLRNYLNLDYSECYDSCVQLVQNYAGRDRLELQFVGSKGEVLASSYGLFAEETVRTSEVSRALESKSNVYFVGENPSTGERIMSVATPMIYADGQAVGVLRFVTSTKKDTVPLGLDGLKAIRQAVRIPIAGIAGITPDNYRQVLEAGADGVAVVSAILGADFITDAVNSFLI